MSQTTRVHGDKAIEKKIISLHKEGWHVPNIASIAQVDADTVREVLNRNKLLLD